MKKKVILWLTLGLILSLLLAACGGGDTPAPAEDPEPEPAPAEEEEMEEEEAMEEEEMEEEEAMEEVEGSIWVLLPDSASSARWETDDRRFFEEAFDAAGVEYNIVNAEGDARTQQTQAEQAITAGAKVILMVNLDSGSGAAIIAAAREADVAIIDYDRLTVEGPGADIYVSFDNVQVGRTMADVLVPLIDAKENPNVVLLNGGPTDNNATLFRDGYFGESEAFFEDGSWNLVDDQFVPEWDNQQALVIFEQILTAADNEVDAVFAANDGLAGAVISAFKNAGIDPGDAGIPISGQDATVSGIQNIIAGDQAMTVYKSIKAEADAAAAAAIALLNGEDVSSLTGGLTLNNGTNDIPFLALDPVGVTIENVAGTVIADGFRTWEEICVGDFEEFCTDEVREGTATAAAGGGGDEAMAEETIFSIMENDEACEVDLTGEEIVVYQQAGREGPLAAILGQGFAFATEDALTLINDNGGICGATLRVEFGETNYDTEQEISVYEQFRAADPKPAILLTYGSGATVALKDRVFEDQIVNIAAGLNAEAIYNPANGYTIGAAPIYSDQFAGYMEWLTANWADVKPESAGDDIVVGVIGWANSFGAGATTDEALAYAEELGVTVLPLEEQAIAPDADVTGQVQNLLLNGANVIYAQSLSFGPAQVVGTIRALGVWDDILVGGVNWSMHDDVPNILGENAALLDGYCGMFPYNYWSETDVPGVQLAQQAFDASGRPESDQSTTYLTTFGTFLAVRGVLIHTVNTIGSADVTGPDVLAAMEDLGTIEGGGISTYTVTADGIRSPRESQVRCAAWDGEQINYTIVQDFFELPNTAPTGE